MVRQYQRCIVQSTDLQEKDCNKRQPLLSVFSPASLIALQLLKSIEDSIAKHPATAQECHPAVRSHSSTSISRNARMQWKWKI
eukprot:16565-Heterococcus_DN1.PRE.1